MRNTAGKWSIAIADKWSFDRLIGFDSLDI